MKVLASSLLLILSAGAACATEPWMGAWGKDQDACKPEPPYVFRAKNMVGPTFACTSALYSKAGKSWRVEAKGCATDAGANFPKAAPEQGFKLSITNNRMNLEPASGGPVTQLVKCSEN